MTLVLQVVATVAAVWLAFLAAVALDEGGAETWHGVVFYVLPLLLVLLAIWRVC